MKKLFLVYIVFSFLSISVYAAKTGSIMLDADSGQVFHAENADSICYPASLTKMMTLYLLFEAIEKKKTTLYHRMPVSAHAAAQEPTKINVRKGQRLLVKHAIEALAVKSANDAAVVIAEFLGGSEAEFAKMMTDKAHSLGMANTVFKNASGLPNPLQHTTPSDLAKLSLALMHHFPDYFTYFSTKTFNYRGKTYRNHNRMLFSYQGCNGLKTGYTRASGFNLAATAIRDNRKLIGVVVGEKSPALRAAKMAKLFNTSFTKLGVKAKGPSCRLVSPGRGLAVCSIPGFSGATRLTQLSHHHHTHRESQNFMAEKPEEAPGDYYLDIGTYQTFGEAEEFMKKALIIGNDLVTRDNFSIDPCIEGKQRYRVKVVDLSDKTLDDLSKIYKNYHVPCLKLQLRDGESSLPRTLKETRIAIAKSKAKKNVKPSRKSSKKRKVIKAKTSKPKSKSKTKRKRKSRAKRQAAKT